jgi:hypothetical protein
MSATNRGAVRHADDFYETPEWCVHALLKRVPLRTHGLDWLEPCYGGGAIVRAVDAFYDARFGVKSPDWHVNDIQLCRVDDGPIPLSVLKRDKSDFLAWDEVDRLRVSRRLTVPPYDVLLTNPPYTLAEEFIVQGLKFAKVVVMLLRLNFLGSQKRAMFFAEHFPDVYVLPRRPSFTGGKTDSCEYAWMIFHREHRAHGIVRRI